MSVATSLRLPEEMNSRLNELAKETGRSKTFYILKALEEYLEDIEDIYLAEKILEGVRAGRIKVHSSEEVEKRLGLEN